MLCQWHINIADMVQKPAVYFFRDPFIKTPIAGFHVEYRDLVSFCSQCSETTVCISINQKGIRFFFHNYFLCPGYNIAYCFAGSGAGNLKKMIRFANLKVLEKHLIQFKIIILSRMH